MPRKLTTLLFSAILANLLAGACCAHTFGRCAPENCDAACTNMRTLGCPEGKDLPDGTTCEKFCQDTVAAGHAMDTQCVASATSCEALHSACGM